MRLTYCFERKLRSVSPALPEAHVESNLGLYLQVALMAVIIVAASWWLARLCDTLSTHRIELIGRPLGATFVGAFFLAVATSLPEIVTSVAAVRLGNLDMALGNIFGSNMFNIFVIPLLKGVSLAHGESRLFANAALDHTQNLLVGLMAIMLTAVALGGLVYKSERRLLQRFGLDSILIAVIYIGGMTLLLLKDG
jgi:cation:H+ antiporter